MVFIFIKNLKLTRLTMVTPYEASKKSFGSGVMFLVALKTLGRVVTWPWKAFLYLLWSLSSLYWGMDVGCQNR